MHMRISDTLKYRKIRNFFLNGRHIHPLLILLIDFFIVFFGFSLSYIIVDGLGTRGFNFAQYYKYTFTFCFIAFPILYLARLHTGLLRFSNTVDLFRIFAATLVFSVIYLLLIVGFGNKITAGEDRKSVV